MTIELSDEKAKHILSTTEAISWLLTEHCADGKLTILTTLLGSFIKVKNLNEKIQEIANTLTLGFDDDEELPDTLHFIMKLLNTDALPIQLSQALITYLLSKEPHEALSISVSNFVSVARNLGMSQTEFESILDTTGKAYAVSLQVIPGKSVTDTVATH